MQLVQQSCYRLMASARPEAGSGDTHVRVAAAGARSDISCRMVGGCVCGLRLRAAFACCGGGARRQRGRASCAVRGC